MALQTSALNAMADGGTAVMGFASLHTGDPGAGGANEVTGGGYARLPITWDPASGGIGAMNGTLSFSGPASSPATHVGVWSALTGGTFHGAEALTGDQAFNAAGEYNVNALTVPVTAA